MMSRVVYDAAGSDVPGFFAKYPAGLPQEDLAEAVRVVPGVATLPPVPPRRPRVLFCGHGRAGKDTACERFAEVTGLRNAGTTSRYLCAYVAGKLGLDPEVAYARRHETELMRLVWYHAGKELREAGASTLVRMALAHGEITGGVRDRAEIDAVRAEGLADLIIWVDNERVPPDPTVKFSATDCDVTVCNHGTLAEFFQRLDRLARFAGLVQGDR